MCVAPTDDDEEGHRGHRQVLTTNLDSLVNLVRADGPLMWYMFEKGAVSDEEKAHCSEKDVNSYECTRRLLEIVIGKATWVYETFLDGLQATERTTSANYSPRKVIKLDVANCQSIKLI